MDTLPLPPRPNLAQYRKRAKDLVKAARSTEPDAVRAWATEWLEALARLRGQTVTPFVEESLDRVVERIEQQVRERPANGTFTLAEAQYLIARAHSFASWRDFAEHVERLSRSGAEADPFESAADAVVTGDLPALESLLSNNPGLIHTRSARVHPRDAAALLGRERRRGLPATDPAQRGGDREVSARGGRRSGRRSRG